MGWYYSQCVKVASNAGKDNCITQDGLQALCKLSAWWVVHKGPTKGHMQDSNASTLPAKRLMRWFPILKAAAAHQAGGGVVQPELSKAAREGARRLTHTHTHGACRHYISE